MSYKIEFADSVKEHFKSLTVRQRTTIMDAIEKQLVYEPLKNKPVAAIVSLKNIDRESLSLSTNPEFMKIIEKSRKDFKFGNKLSFGEMKKEIDKMK